MLGFEIRLHRFKVRSTLRSTVQGRASESLKSVFGGRAKTRVVVWVMVMVMVMVRVRVKG